MRKLIKVGIGGLGRSGYGIHANWIKNVPDRFQIVAVADELPERCAEAAKLFGCRTFSNYREMLDEADFDLFVNSTPSRFHVDAALASFAAGKHVLQEKPCAKRVADFDLMVEAAQKTERVLYSFQNSRFFPFFIKMREIIESGVLGEIVYIRSNWSGFSRRWDWQTLRSEWGGNLLNTGPHPLDQAIVLFGEGYPNVFCRMYANHPSGGDAENFCALVLYGKHKPMIEIVLNSFQAYPQGDMYNISGTCGGLSATPTTVKWKYFDPANVSIPKLLQGWSDNRQYCVEQLPWIEESWNHNDENSHDVGFPEIIAALYGNLYEVLVNGATPEIAHDEVRRQIYVIEQAASIGFCDQ